MAVPSARERADLRLCVLVGALLIAMFVARPAGATSANAVPNAMQKVTFGNIPVNTTATRTLAIPIASGYEFGSPSGTGLTAPFSLDTDTCDGFAGPGSCDVVQSFSPTAVTSSGATTVLSQCPLGGGTCSAVTTLDLTGAGVSVMAESPNPVAFGNVDVNTSATATVVVNVDTGFEMATIGSFDGPLTYVGGTCFGTTTNFTGPGTCTTVWSFTPTTVGSDPSMADLYECAGTTCLDTVLESTGTGVSVASVSPTAVDFGTVPIGLTVSRTVTMRIDAGYQLLGSGDEAPFGSTAGTCFPSASFTGPGTCSFTVTYAPTAATATQGTIDNQECRDDETDCIPMDIALDGTGEAAGLPLTPGFPTAQSSLSSAKVSWLAPSGNGSAITGYVITPYRDGIAAEPPQTFTSPASSDIVTGLINNVPYTFRIAAVNSVGEGAQSSPTAKILIGEPSPPILPSAEPGGDTTATVSWHAGAPNEDPITGYVVTPYIGTAAQPAQTFSTTATTEQLTGLTDGTSYTFKIAATNAIGTGAQSVATSAIVEGSPSSPVLQTASPGNGSARVSWFPQGSNASPITGYVITAYVKGVSTATQVFGTAANSDVMTGLTNGTSYTFKICTQNAVGTGPPSNATAAIVVGAPNAPAAPKATAGAGQVHLSWVAPANNGSPVTGYVVTPYIAGVAQAPTTLASTVTTATIGGLTSGTSYTFKIAAINARGDSPQSPASTPVTPS